MRGLFVRTLFSFVLALLVMVAVLGGVLLLGFDLSVAAWSDQRTNQMADYAVGVLTGQIVPVDKPPPADTPVFVYDSAGQLIYSNRGEGRRIDPGDRVPVEKGGQALGSYVVRGTQFSEDSANQAFVSSLSVAFWVGVPASFVLAFVFAAYFAMRLSRPAARVAAGLDRIGGGDLSRDIPESGPHEIARIARTANRMQRQLAGEREIRKQWAQDVAHDLRTPIAALKAQFEAMKDGVLQPTQDRIVRTLGEIERVEALVSALDELARLESPEMKTHKELFATRVLLEETAELFAHVISVKDVHLETRADIPEICADRALTARALTNLISNATRHVDEGGRITLFASQEGAMVALGVHNTGQPIPPDEINHVSERLFRGDRARGTPGSGLGLTIARQIAELHGGDLTIESSESRGTTVTIRLRV